MGGGDERIVSLLPSATEIVGFLGLKHLLVGVSHECDVLGPEDESVDALVASGKLLRVTASTIHPHESSQAEINDVRSRPPPRPSARERPPGSNLTARGRTT